METKLTRIAEIAKERPNERITALAHLINKESIKESHRELKARKATGIDDITKEEYEKNLTGNIDLLVDRMKKQAYKPQPVRRVYIPKAGTDKMRPLGIPAYEDKLVQNILNKILNAVFEGDFLDSSFGFRPNRSCHDVLKVITHIIENRKISYIVDTDIKGFFEHVDHNWLMKFIEHRIADVNIYRLIVRFLKAGVLESGKYSNTEEGTPQGGLISPILGNIYLHYVLDLWFEKVVRRHCKGDAYMVRYADDSIFCFQYEEEAKAFYQQLKERLRKFNLELADDKTKIIKFGRFAEAESKKTSGGKSETFDFLGFTHCCSKSAKGYFRVKRKTSKKKYKASLKRCKTWLRENLTTPTVEIMRKLAVKLKGYYRYYGVTDNSIMLSRFVDEVRSMLYKILNRKSQKKSFNWEKYVKFLQKYPLVRPKITVNIYELRSEISYIM
ncbi:MAG: group II intron reverse transcriptase/maturase [Lutisporaceae bacterium]